MRATIFLAIALTALTSVLSQGQGAPTNFDITKYGAVGDGKTLNSAAIDKAIDAAAAAGGGTVYVPAGTFLAGTLHLKSNVAVYLDQGAEIQATTDPTAYDVAEPNVWEKYQDYGHTHFHNSLFCGENLHDIAILGPGRIYGKGLTKKQFHREGNKAISLKLCRNVILRDFTILMGGHFGILATGVDNLTIDNLKIDTNRDGMDVDSCRNVRISNCTVNSPTDDGICLKSDFSLGYARATENVTITNCQVSGFDAGTLLAGTYKRESETDPLRGGRVGRIKFGTESNGGFKNITISNCVVAYCRGIALETVDGGPLEDISISNITMRDVANSPIFLRIGSRMRGPDGVPIGVLRRINISDITAYDVEPSFACLIAGIPGHDVEDVKLSNIRIYYRGGGTKEQAARVLAEQEKDYPEPSMFGPTSAYGFYIRHAKNVQMDNVQVSFMNEDLRPAFQLIDVKGAEFNNVRAQVAAGVPVFDLKDVIGFVTHRAQGLRDMNLKSVKQKAF